MKALLPLLVFATATLWYPYASAQEADPFAALAREYPSDQRHAAGRLEHALDSLADQIRDSRTIVRAVMLVKCNTIIRVTRIYGDGSMVVTDVGDIQATDAELAGQAASYPFMQIVSECSR